MFATPGAEDPFLFGDVFTSSWLREAWIEEDAVQLGPTIMKGKNPGYAAHMALPHHNFLLAHGSLPLAVVSIDDDCYLETVTSRHGHGRLHFAPIFSPTDEDPEGKKFARLYVEGMPEIGTATADMRHSFTVRAPNKDFVERLRSHRIFRLEGERRAELEARWAAHVVRRGSVVALSAGNKLLNCCEHKRGSLADEDRAASDALAELLRVTWSVEGALIDLVDVADEQRQKKGTLPDGTMDELRARVDRLQRASKEALDALGAAESW